MPADMIAEAIPRLLGIGWLEYDTVASHQNDGAILQDTIASQRDDGAFQRTFAPTDITDSTRQEGHSCASDDARVSVDDPPFSTTEPDALFPVEAKAKTKKAPRNNQAAKLTPQQEAWFAEWWPAYWLHKARLPAREAFRKHVTTDARFAEVMAATRAQSPEMLARDPSKRPHGATWLNAERWTDEIAAEPVAPPMGKMDRAIAQAVRELAEERARDSRRTQGE
jgi:hypothetical protein